MSELGFEFTTLVVIGTGCICNYGNYHAITTTTDLVSIESVV